MNSKIIVRHYQAAMWFHFEEFRTFHRNFFPPKNRTARSYSKTCWIPLPSQLLLRQTAACGSQIISPCNFLSCPQLIQVSSSRTRGDETGPSLLNNNTPSCFRINSCWDQADCVGLPGDPGRYCCVSYSHTTFARFSLQAKNPVKTKVRLCLVEDWRTRSTCLNLKALAWNEAEPQFVRVLP